MRVVFMGTPDFAAVSLQKLIDSDYEVVGVFCQPDKQVGRGMNVSFGPVKRLALENNIPVYQPLKMKDGEAYKAISSLNPDFLAVVAYGRILPDDILSIPKLGAINVHGSLLPKYRGAAPIQWAVLNGDDISGVTTMYMAHDMDAGDIIYQEQTPIGQYETAGELFDRLAVMGSELLIKTLDDIVSGKAPRTAQNHEEATYVSILDKSLCPIDFSNSAKQVIKHIYGLNPWPVATAVIGGAELRIFSAEYRDNKTSCAPGTIIKADNDGIEIACGDGGTVLITEVQAPGKKRMKASDYLRGHKING